MKHTTGITFIFLIFFSLIHSAKASDSTFNTLKASSTLASKHWRTHTEGSYGFDPSIPDQEKRACYSAVFFGDSLCAGLNLSNLFKPLRSYCENMAIHFSELTNNTPIMTQNYSKSGSSSSAILKQMQQQISEIKKADLIVWDAGGNDLLFASRKFRKPFLNKDFCRLCFLDNELGNPYATGPDPRCGGRIGALQSLTSNTNEMIQILKTHAKSDAVLRMMGLYYGHFELDEKRILNCKDPDTGISYATTRDAVFPVILKGIYSMMDRVSQEQAKNDKRFQAFDTFARFNTQNLELRETMKYQPGDSLVDYVVGRILSNKSELSDPYAQTYSSSPGVRPPSPLIQKFLGKVDVHPSQAGHDLLEELSRSSMENIEIPQASMVGADGECRQQY